MDTNMTDRLFAYELERGFKQAGVEFENFREIFMGLDQDSWVEFTTISRCNFEFVSLDGE